LKTEDGRELAVPRERIARMEFRDDHPAGWVAFGDDGAVIGNTTNLDAVETETTVPAVPGWRVAYPLFGGEGDDGPTTLAYADVVAWRVRGDLAEPVTACAESATDLALLVPPGGGRTIDNHACVSVRHDPKGMLAYFAERWEERERRVAERVARMHGEPDAA
jgi:hypothetical protein